MSVVGTAYVEIRAIGDKLNSDIKKQLESSIDKSIGDDVGKKISESIETSTAKHTAESSKRIGRQVGSSIEKSINTDMRRRRIELPEFDDARMRGSLRRALMHTAVFFQRIDGPIDRFANQMDRVGQRISKATVLIVRPMRAMMDSTTGAVVRLGALPTALGAAAGALSALASSAFAMGAAIGPSINSLAILPGALTAVVAPAAAGIIAFGGVADAYKAMVKAMDGTEASMKKAEEALAKLSPKARAFTETLFDNRDAFLAVREAAGEKLFGKLEEALDNIVNNGTLDGLSSGLREAGGVLGDIAVQFSNLLGNEIFQGRMSEMFDSAMVSSRDFGKALINLTNFFVTLGAAAAPVTEDFSRWIRQLTGGWAKRANNNFDSLREKIVAGAEVAKQLGRIFGNLWGIIVNLGDAARESGQSLLDSFEEATAKLETLTGDSSNKEKFKKFFEDTANNTRALGSLFNVLFVEILKLGDNPAIAEMSGNLEEAVKNIGEISDIALTAFGPKLTDVIEKATELFVEFMEAGGTKGMEAVLPVIESFLDILLELVKIPGFATFIGYLTAFGSAFSILAKIKVPKPLQVIFGEIFNKYLPKIMPLISRFAPRLLALAGPIGIAVGALLLLGQGFKWLYDNVGGFRDFIDGIVASIRELGHRILEIGKAILPNIKAAFQGAVDVVVNVFNVIKTTVVAIWDSIVAFFSGDADKIPGILNEAFGKIIVYVSRILDGLKQVVSNIWDAIVTATGGKIYTFIESVKNAFQPIVDVVTGVFGAIKTTITTIWDSLVALFTGRASEIPAIIGAGFDKVKEHISTALRGAVTIVSTVWNALVAVIRNAGERMVAAVVFIWNTVTSVVSTVFGAMKNVVVSVTQGMITFVINIFQSMRWVITTVMTVIREFVASRIHAIRVVFITIFSAIRVFIGKVFRAIRDRIRAIISGVVDFVVSRFNNLKRNVTIVFTAVRVTLRKAWEWIKARVFSPMRDGINAVRATFARVGNKIKEIWKNLRDKLREGYNAIKTRVFNALKSGLNAVRDRFSAIRDRIRAIWNNLRDKLRDGYTSIKTRVFDALKNGLNSVRDRFSSIRDRIKSIWENLGRVLRNGWTWIKDNVFGKFKDGLTGIKTAFNNVKNGIKNIWQKLKAITAKPVNFVLGTVYNNGIRKWWNKISGAVGLKSLSLPPASTVTGFAKGTEDHRAQIARAGSMRLWAEPETGGEAYIPLAKSKRKRSLHILRQVARRFGVDLDMFNNGGFFKGSLNKVSKSGVTAFKNGGFWSNPFGNAWNGVKNFGKKVWDGAKIAAEIIANPVSAIKRAAASIANSKGTGGFANNGLFKVAAQLPAKFATGLGEKVKSLFAAGKGKGGIGAGGGGAGGSELSGKLSSMARIAQAIDSSVRVTSGRRAGARTVTGYVSYHAKGRALDLVSSNMGKLWDKLYARFGKTSPELFYSGRYFSRFGKKGAPRGDHWDHVHWAMKNGGLFDWVGKMTPRNIPALAAGGTVAARPGGVLAQIAEGGHAERVTPLRSDGLSEGEYQMLQAIKTNSGRPIQIVVQTTPGQDNGAVAQAVSRRLAWEMRGGK